MEFEGIETPTETQFKRALESPLPEQPRRKAKTIQVESMQR